MSIHAGSLSNDFRKTAAAPSTARRLDTIFHDAFAFSFYLIGGRTPKATSVSRRKSPSGLYLTTI